MKVAERAMKLLGDTIFYLEKKHRAVVTIQLCDTQSCLVLEAQVSLPNVVVIDSH